MLEILIIFTLLVFMELRAHVFLRTPNWFIVIIFSLVFFRDDASLVMGDGLDDNDKEPKKKVK